MTEQDNVTSFFIRRIPQESLKLDNRPDLLRSPNNAFQAHEVRRVPVDANWKTLSQSVLLLPLSQISSILTNPGSLLRLHSSVYAHNNFHEGGGTLYRS